MYATERHDRILGELERAGRVSVASLSQVLDVTAETIRRDLDALEATGALRRVHGGAVRRSSLIELGIGERERRNTPAKRAIAAAALDLVRQTAPAAISIDAGTTTRAFADLLADHVPAEGRLGVVTNAVPILLRLQDN
uniref:DeoR family transcriptional regulator n=1 Tax=uncultured Amnibacterium sp. TaxID=1631851 RepID=UPI0035CBFCBC